MSRFDRAVGLARSLAIYHGIPTRQRNLRRLYAELVRTDDLVFDVGAHAGNHVRACLALGCRIVALEPQPDFAWLLRRLFGRSSRVTVIESAAGEASGRASLSVSERTPTVTSLATRWRDDRSHEPGFDRVRWNRRIDVDLVTLDQLIAQFGAPSFIKIDAEGSEPAVLAGLTHPVPALSFEYLPGALALVEACATRLLDLGSYVFNWSAGESHHVVSSTWLQAPALMDSLRTPDAQRRSGDIYARLARPTSRP